MRRQVGIALIALASVTATACSSNTPGSAQTEKAGSPTGAQASSDAALLKGEWDTGPYPSSRVRAAIVAAGYASADAAEPSGGGKRFEFNLTFYKEGGIPFVVATGWDPSKHPKPSGGDHGPYRLLPNDQIAIACDVCDLDTQYMLFSYELNETTLTLHFIRSVDPQRTAKELHDDAPFLIAWTAAPFHKID